MKKRKYSKVVYAGLIALSAVAPNTQWTINALEIEDTDAAVEQTQITKPEITSEEVSVSEVATAEPVQANETVTVLQGDEVVYPTKITIDYSLLNLGVGDEKDIKVVSWSGASNWDKNTGITWSSSAPEVVSVDAAGHIVALKNGQAVITATVTGNPSVSASCTVYVNDEAPAETYPTKLTLPATKSLNEGQSTKLSVGYGGHAYQ